MDKVDVKSKKLKVKGLPGYYILRSSLLGLPSVLMLIICSLLLMASSFAQSKNDCLRKVVDFNKKMKQLATPQGAQVCYFHYTTQTTFWEAGNQAPENTEIKIWVSKDQMHFVTPDVEVYQDMQDAFMIIHSRKMVIWADSSPEKEKEERLKLLNRSVDTLLATSTVTSCENVTLNGKKVQKIVLTLSPGGKQAASVSQVTYWYELATGSIIRCVLLFTGDRDMKSMTNIYKEVNFRHPLRMSKPVATLVMKNTSQLLARYQGYQLIDNRNQN